MISLPSGHRLIGRDTELARVARLLTTAPGDIALPGDTAALLVTGPRGAGKSSLLLAGTQLARDAGRHRVVRLHGTSPAGRRPFRQILLALRQELPGLPPQVSGPARAAIGLEPDARPISDEDLPSVVRAAIVASAATSPILIIADDADRLGPDVLGLLARVSGCPGVAVLVATREPVPAMLAALPVLRLPPLRPDAATQLFTDRNPVTTAQRRAEILHLAAGNPAALVELGHSVPPCGGLLAETTETLTALPAPTRALLLRAAALLPGDPALIFPTASGPGDPALIFPTASGSGDPALMSPTASGPGDPALIFPAGSGPGDWQPAVEAGLVTFTAAGLAFAHPLAAEAAYRAVPAHERLRAHQDLAVALTAHPEHRALQLAAAPGTDEEVAAAAEAAAAVFRDRGDRYEATTAMWKAALRSPAPADAARRLVRAVADARDLRDTEWVAELHAELCRLTDDPDLLAEAAGSTTAAMLWAGWHREAYDILLATHDVGPAADPRHALNLAVIAASIAWLTGEREHRAGLIRMLEAAGTTADPVAATVVRTVIDPSAHHGRELCRSITVPPPGEPLDPRGRTRLMQLGLIAWAEDESSLAARALTRALTGGTRPEHFAPAGGSVIALVTALIDAGEWQQADRYADPRTATGLPALSVGLASLRALLHALRGEHAQALHLTQQAWQQLDVRENLSTHVRLLRAAGLACIGGGDHTNGYRYLRAMFDPDGRPVHPHLSPRSVAELAGAAVRCDRHGDARTVVDAVTRDAGDRPSARMRVLLRLSEALLAGDEDAGEHFRLAAGEADGPRWPYENAVVHLHHGVWLRRHRGVREARTALSYAQKIFLEIGARDAAGIAAREIAVGSPPAPVAGRSACVALTSQETQVAALAAQGLSNRAIAERLFISARTVATHLSRVYSKTGIRSRHELHAATFAPTVRQQPAGSGR
ncbi:LuxR family transcriptional regulator [Actinoplanes sp. DH11]|uniref:helix-turn-helix transcriptional regulator n=1 Tax=Actinoplanes sp. DH11 TaxID=2857011 RepID=UPI001E563141|nr:LuxR family transcriptional regulator [Actinoplanes sp. DH11]